jgi:hypothetical protein
MSMELSLALDRFAVTRASDLPYAKTERSREVVVRT